MKSLFSVLIGSLWLLAASALSAVAEEPAAESEKTAFFEKKIRPILVEHCHECHGEAEEPEGGLRLDSRTGWQVGGDTGTAIEPGKPDESLLLRALRYDDPNLQMPPDGRLPEAVIRDFEKWIAEGATDPRQGTAPVRRSVTEFDIQQAREFWAYRLPQSPAIPEVQDRSWPRGDIDRFILARLEQAGLAPADDTDRVTLVRRLYFDLLGLPPTPEQIDAFMNDTQSGAYERLVDELLASPHFGERWGRHWLDVARYAESMTLRGFVFPEAWRYRDYVISSFNDDRPYHELVREHVAGDLLPAETLQQQQRQRTATTFLVLGNLNLEEQDKGQLRMDVVDEQLEAIGRAFLAQTIGCARCHDHKFDPIPTRDYYALAGILRNTKTLEHANVSKWLEFPLPLPEQQERTYRENEERIAAIEKRIKNQKTLLASLDKQADSSAVVAIEALPGIVVDDAMASRVGEWQHSQYNKRYIGDGYSHDKNENKGEKTLTFLPELPRAGKYEVRLAYTHGGNRASNVPVTIFSADGEFTKTIDQRPAPALGGRFVSLGQYKFELNGQGFVIVSTEGTDGHVIADAVQFLPLDQVASSGQPERSPEQAQAKSAAEQELQQLEAELKKLQAELPKRPMVMSVVDESSIEETRVHIRGSVHNLGESAPRGFLQVASYDPLPEFPGSESGRRELAEWLASPNNPLTARVYVNRVWHWLMGAGLVRTTDNFGTTGEPPSHPELLDYLALEFQNDGWSTKRLVRRIVLSRAYRLSSTAPAWLVKGDPENRLFGRGHRRRLEAECLLDAMLLASGRLQTEIGGATIAPGTSADYNYNHQFTRRAIYAPVFRNALPEIFEAFDFPDPSVVTGTRNVSTVAPQSLFMMNHPLVREQAQHTARRLLTQQLDDEARLHYAFRSVLGRMPTPPEQAPCAAFLDSVRDADSDEQQLEAWTQLVHALFASLDFRYLY